MKVYNGTNSCTQFGLTSIHRMLYRIEIKCITNRQTDRHTDKQKHGHAFPLKKKTSINSTFTFFKDG